MNNTNPMTLSHIIDSDDVTSQYKNNIQSIENRGVELDIIFERIMSDDIIRNCQAESLTPDKIKLILDNPLAPSSDTIIARFKDIACEILGDGYNKIIKYAFKIEADTDDDIPTVSIERIR